MFRNATAQSDRVLDETSSAVERIDVALARLSETTDASRTDVQKCLRKARRSVRRASAAAYRAKVEVERASVQARVQSDLQTCAVRNDWLDTNANVTRVFLRIRANGTQDLEQSLEDAVLSSNRMATFLDKLVEEPSGVGVREIMGLHPHGHAPPSPTVDPTAHTDL